MFSTSAFGVDGFSGSENSSTVSSDSTQIYDVKNSVAADLSAAFSVNGVVSAEVTSTYYTQNAGSVGTSNSIGYVVRGGVQADANAGYFVHSSLSSDIAAVFAVRGVAAASLVTSYAVDSATWPVSSDLMTAYSIGGVYSFPSAAEIAAAVWSHATGASVAIRMAEAWGRLGLDASKPLVSGQTEITFGDIVMALTGNEVTSTLTRQ